jgi:hypothetical protein
MLPPCFLPKCEPEPNFGLHQEPMRQALRELYCRLVLLEVGIRYPLAASVCKSLDVLVQRWRLIPACESKLLKGQRQGDWLAWCLYRSLGASEFRKNLLI